MNCERANVMPPRAKTPIVWVKVVINLFLDESKARRRAAIEGLRSQVGVCPAGSGFDHVDNALRGDWTMACELGRLRVTITLAPTMPPTVQFLSVNAVPAGDTGARAGTCPQ